MPVPGSRSDAAQGGTGLAAANRGLSGSLGVLVISHRLHSPSQVTGAGLGQRCRLAEVSLLLSAQPRPQLPAAGGFRVVCRGAPPSLPVRAGEFFLTKYTRPAIAAAPTSRMTRSVMCQSWMEPMLVLLSGCQRRTVASHRSGSGTAFRDTGQVVPVPELQVRLRDLSC